MMLVLTFEASGLQPSDPILWSPHAVRAHLAITTTAATPATPEHLALPELGPLTSAAQEYSGSVNLVSIAACLGRSLLLLLVAGTQYLLDETLQSLLSSSKGDSDSLRKRKTS